VASSRPSTAEPQHVLILAAGHGKRLKSSRIKLLHEVAGRPMVDYVLAAARRVGTGRRVVVLGHQADAVRQRLTGYGFRTVLQKQQLGTGHAVLQAAPLLARAGGSVLVLNGDLPGLHAATLQRFVSAHRRSGAGASLMTAEVADPTGYGRVLRDGDGRFQRIVEHVDASAAEREVREINAGIYCFSTGPLFRLLKRLRPRNRQKELYLPDVLALMCEEGLDVRAVIHLDAWEILGVNSRRDLAEASRLLNARRLETLMASGVTALDPDTIRVGPDVRIGRDVILSAGVHIEGATTIGRGTTVGPGCVLRDCRIGRDVTLLPYTVAAESIVGDGSRIGPFAHLRPGTVLARGVHVGNYVEVKKSSLGRGSKANHLSYLGDAVIGRGVNVGAGTITCNYDGERKHVTVIEDRAFIGSDTQLIAPVTIGRGAYVGTGTTVREAVPPGALAVSAGRQRNIEGWVAARKKRNAAPAKRAGG